MKFVCPRCGSEKMELQGSARLITWEINLENYPDIEYDNPCVCEESNQQVVCGRCGTLLFECRNIFDAEDEIREYLEKNGVLTDGQ